MKTIFILSVCCVGAWLCQAHPRRAIQVPVMASAKTDSINFKTQIQPIFEKNCSPCHFPGGKMYEKLPFDQPETIVDHQQVIFKRLKKEDDINLIKQYLQQGKTAN